MNTKTNDDALVLYGQRFESRLLLGTSRYPSPAILEAAVERSKPAMVTASLRRQGSNTADAAENGASFWELLRKLNVPVLPNTAGCMTIQEAVTTAQMAREVFDTPWIKLELIGDDYTLQPDTLNLVEAASILIKDGFQVLPYTTYDLVLCQKLVDVGCQAVMPWAAPIGTGRGPVNPYAMQMLRERLKVPLIVDAGLGLGRAVGGLDGLLAGAEGVHLGLETGAGAHQLLLLGLKLGVLGLEIHQLGLDAGLAGERFAGEILPARLQRALGGQAEAVHLGVQLVGLQLDALAAGGHVRDTATNVLQQLQLALVGVVQGLPGVLDLVEGLVGLRLENEGDAFKNAGHRLVLPRRGSASPTVPSSPTSHHALRDLSGLHYDGAHIRSTKD